MTLRETFLEQQAEELDQAREERFDAQAVFDERFHRFHLGLRCGICGGELERNLAGFAVHVLPDGCRWPVCPWPVVTVAEMAD